MNKDKLKADALTERIGQLVAMYEDRIADYRAEATVTIQQLQSQIAELQERLANVQGEKEEPAADSTD
jgi:uncharacterized coiled-coil protein SlyX